MAETRHNKSDDANGSADPPAENTEAIATITSARTPSPSSVDNVAAGANSNVSNLQLCLLIGGLFCGTFVMALDATIIGTVVPIISAEFNALDDIAWYGSGYLLTITALQPTFGKLYRVADVKLAFIACIVIFEVGSILCAAAPSSAVFIAGRAVAGAGAAGLFQGALVIITRSVGLQRRPLCISIITSAFAVSVCIGPPIGGAFADNVSWRWAFWINVPIGAVVLVLVFFLLRLPKEGDRNPNAKKTTLLQKAWELDPFGALLIIAAVVCLLLALQWGGQSRPWSSSSVIGLLVGFVVILGIFFWTQWRLGDDATLPLWVFRRRSLLAAAAFSFFFSMPSYVYGTYVPIYFQAVRASTALQSGVQFLALAIPQIFGVVFAGAFVSMLGLYVPFMIVGTAIGMVGSGLFLMLDLETSRALWATFLVICGLGTGFAINLPYTVVQAILTEDEVPTGNAVFQFMFQLGAAISLSIGETIFLNELKASTQALVPSIPYNVLVSAGAYNLRGLFGANDDGIYDLVRRVYMNALHSTYIYPVVAAGVALITTLSLENKNLKHVEKERKKMTEEKTEEGPGAKEPEEV